MTTTTEILCETCGADECDCAECGEVTEGVDPCDRCGAVVCDRGLCGPDHLDRCPLPVEGVARA